MAPRRFLGPALVMTWLVGMGRYWDHSSAHSLQRLGVGSVVYVFALSALLWAVIAPLNPKQWSYVRTVTFVTLTSPPAALYAIPVERWMPVEEAASVNAWFLAVVAAWRVALLLFVLRRFAELSWPRTVVGSLLPLVGIVVALAALNLERAVFEIMAGNNPRPPTSGDRAYLVVLLLSVASMYVIGPLVLVYILLVARAFVERRPHAGA